MEAKTPVLTRITETERASLGRIAYQQDRSVSSLLRSIIREYLQREETKA